MMHLSGLGEGGIRADAHAGLLVLWRFKARFPA